MIAPDSQPTPPDFHKNPLPGLMAAQVLAALGLGVWAWILNAAAPGWVPSALNAPGSSALWMLAQGAVAAAISRAFGLGWGWMALQAALPVVAWTALSGGVASWVYLLAFALLAALYSNTLFERVPLYLTNRATWRALDALLDDEKQTGRFVDLGAGFGGPITFLAAHKPNWRFDGVESAPLVFVLAWLRLRLGGSVATIRFRRLWNEDLGTADVVYAFLSPAPMARLLEKAGAEMKPGSLFISNSFWADEMPYDATVEVDDERKTRLYLKRF